MILVSTPPDPSGRFYKLYQAALDEAEA